MHRIIGTYGGVILTAVLLLTASAPVEPVFLLAVVQLLGEVFVIRRYGTVLVFMTPAALPTGGIRGPVVRILPRHGPAAETTIGAARAFPAIWSTTRRQRTAAQKVGSGPVRAAITEMSSS